MSDRKVIITIGRSFGSHGAEIGRVLAGKLGIPFYDKEILEEQVKKSDDAQESNNQKQQKEDEE